MGGLQKGGSRIPPRLKEAGVSCGYFDERNKWYGLQDVMDYITNEVGFYEVGLSEAFPAVVDDKAFIDEVLALYLRYKYEAESDNDYARGWRYCLEDALKEIGEKHPVYKTWVKAYM